MFMHHALRFILLPIFVAAIGSAAWAMEEGPDVATSKTPNSKSAEYKRSDANYYLKSDILKVNPIAVIIPKGGYTQQDDSYFFTPKIKAPKTLQFEVLNDWIEPITPPDAPPTLSMPPDAMQIREPQGNVRVALPSAPGNFTPVADGMPLVNGAVVKTGANATAAVLFGGVFSARLMPNSAAAVQQTVTATSRVVEVDLTSGGVFSKVGQQVGVKGEYSVHTPFGNAVARGTDFVTITTANRTDVWVAQGTVSLEPPDSKAGQMATSDGTGALKLMRFPAIADARQAMAADAETLTMIFDFIPMANQKIASLRAKITRGEKLTPGQQDYLNRIKQVPTLIKLALVEKAPPPPPAPTPPPTPAPAPAPKPIAPLATPAAVPREPAAEGGSTPPPMTITLGPGDLVHFENANTTVTKLKARLAELAKANPAQPLEIARDTSVGPILLKRVVDACHHEKLTTKVLDPTPAPAVVAPPPAPTEPTPAPAKPATENAPPPPAMTITLGPGDQVHFEGANTTVTKLKARLAEIAKTNSAQPLEIARDSSVGLILLKRVEDACQQAKLAMKVLDPTPAAPVPAKQQPNPDVTATNVQSAAQRSSTKTSFPKTPPVSESPKAKSVTEPEELDGSVIVRVHTDGSVGFKGATITLTEFQVRLQELIKTTPDQSFILEAGMDVPYDKLQAVLDSCRAAGVKDVSIAGTSSLPAPDKTPAHAPPAPKALPVTESPNASPVTEPAKPQGPITVQVHMNGTIGFKGNSVTLAEFQAKLKALIKTTPDQELVIKSGAKVPYDKLKAVLDSCADAQVRHVTVASPSPTPPPAPESPATNLPAPTLLMHPSMETMSSNAPPIAPTSPAAPPATNAPPAGP